MATVMWWQYSYGFEKYTKPKVSLNTAALEPHSSQNVSHNTASYQGSFYQ